MNITTTLSQKGQVTLPIAIRNMLNLQPFDKLVFSVEGEKILATPVKEDILDLYGSVKHRGKKPADLHKIRQEMTKRLAASIAKEGAFK